MDYAHPLPCKIWNYSHSQGNKGHLPRDGNTRLGPWDSACGMGLIVGLRQYVDRRLFVDNSGSANDSGWTGSIVEGIEERGSETFVSSGSESATFAIS